LTPSSTPCLGDIPSDWDAKKIRFAATLRSEVSQYTQDDIYIGLENVESFTGNIIETETGYEEGTYDIFKKGDVLFGKLRPYLAKAFIATFDGFCTGEFLIFKKYEGNKKILFYYLLSDSFLTEVNASTFGSKMPRADWEHIRNMFIPVPPLPEQNAIAAFLDEKCGIIDSIIKDIDEQIDILNQYKKAVITETITKGLDKNAPMKDSGIEWIGKIPAYWETKRLRYVCNIKTGTTPDANEGINIDGNGINWFTPSDIGFAKILKNSEKFIEKTAITKYNIKSYPPDSVLMIGIGATVGKIGYTVDSSYSNQQITALSPYKDSGKYLFYFFTSKSDFIKDNALYATLPIINNTYLSDVYCVIPAKEEQCDIVKHLDSKCAEIDSLISQKQESIRTMQEYKKAIIYEYTTGKKRVRGFPF
jgi:type I restriction enzyme S subunit